MAPPPILGPIIGGLASLAGGFMSNNANADIARSQNRHNERMLHEQNRFNLEMWNRQNAYNTPKEQRSRYEQAGINPYLALGNITAGTAQGVTSASPAPAVGYQYQDPIGPAINTAVNAYVSDMQAQKMRSERDLTIENVISQRIDNAVRAKRNGLEMDNVQSQIDLNKANANKANADTRFVDYSIDRLKELTPLQKTQLAQEIVETASRVQLNRVDELLKRFELNHGAQARLKQTLATAFYLRAQGKLSLEQVKLVGSQIGLNNALESGVRWDNNQKALFSANLKERIELLDKDLKASTALKNQQTNFFDNQTTIGYINAVNGIFGNALDLGGMIATGGMSSGLKSLGKEMKGLRNDVQGLSAKQNGLPY